MGDAEFSFKANQGGYGVGRAGAEAALHREPLFNMDLDIGGEAEGLKSQRDHLPGGIAAVGGDAGVVRGEPQSCGCRGTGLDGDHVVKGKGLVDGGQRVEAVGAGRSNMEAEVDLCVRADGCGHTGSL